MNGQNRASTKHHKRQKGNYNIAPGRQLRTAKAKHNARMKAFRREIRKLIRTAIAHPGESSFLCHLRYPVLRPISYS
jgi:hypothetical protein